ncbi:MAG: hypothetical protein ABSF26_07605 [Thermoguttaceae bacterium]
MLLIGAAAGWHLPAASAEQPAGKLPTQGESDRLESLLSVLAAVGPGGAGQGPAAAAWKQIIEVDAQRLPEVLAALDRAGPLAANWLRTAAETIAQRRLEQGGKLPERQLEAFVLDRRHAPRARHLAYQWLVRVDRAAPDRLLPGMLDDPSTDLRRAAVARLVAQAEAAPPGADHQLALAAYRRAIEAAADPDQVQLLAQRLQALGQAVDRPRLLGLIVRWKVLGPLDNAGDRGFDRVEGPERETDPHAAYPGKHGPLRWTDAAADADSGLLDLNRVLGAEKGVTAFAMSEFFAPQARNVQIRMGSANAVKLWLNGRLIDQHHAYHSGSAMDQFISGVVLQPGRNVILVKICQNEQTQDWAADWSFQLRVCDPLGRAVLSADRDQAPAHPKTPLSLWERGRG